MFRNLANFFVGGLIVVGLLVALAIGAPIFFTLFAVLSAPWSWVVGGVVIIVVVFFVFKLTVEWLGDKFTTL